jgi:hypothetical protein
MGIRLNSLNNLVSMNLQGVELYQQDRQCTLIHLAGIQNCIHSSYQYDVATQSFCLDAAPDEWWP